ncbi:MAG: ferritin-like domain-containing protein [Gemmatimonadales bacterium]
MTQQSMPGEAELAFLGRVANASGRRQFLQWAGLTVGVLALGCSDDNGSGPNPASVDLGSGDTGVLNYAYALEQLEAAFYTQVAAAFYSGITAEEQQILTDIKGHEVIHRDFLKAALGSAAIADLSVDFSGIDFTSRTSVLTAAQTFEDLGVSAYNGAGRLITSPDYLLVAGKIVSVEARHASAIRDLLAPDTAAFAGDDVVTVDTGLDGANAPATVLAAADSYVTTTIDASHLPTA